MRSRKSHCISAGEVQQWGLSWLIDSMRRPNHGWKCTAVVVWNSLLRAAARMCSIAAVCRDLANAPSDQAVFDALHDGLPKTWKTLEGRLGELIDGSRTASWDHRGHLSQRLRKRSWNVAIDWHPVPGYGQPDKSENELRRSKSQQGTSTFHTSATAGIVSHGVRDTLVVTWVRRRRTTGSPPVSAALLPPPARLARHRRQQDRHGATNLAAMRRLAVSLLHQEKTVTRGAKNRRLKCSLTNRLPPASPDLLSCAGSNMSRHDPTRGLGSGGQVKSRRSRIRMLIAQFLDHALRDALESIDELSVALPQ